MTIATDFWELEDYLSGFVSWVLLTGVILYPYNVYL